MGVLVGRKHSYLLDEFCKRLQEMDLADPLSIPGDLTEEQKLTIHLLTGQDRDVCWQRFFIACHKWNKHGFGLIMVSK